MSDRYFVYTLASWRYGTLYLGMTNDLARRLHQHRSGTVSAFTREYAVHRLVHYETYEDLTSARERERSLKGSGRAWKINLIEEHNLDWADLTPSLVQL